MNSELGERYAAESWEQLMWQQELHQLCVYFVGICFFFPPLRGCLRLWGLDWFFHPRSYKLFMFSVWLKRNKKKRKKRKLHRITNLMIFSNESYRSSCKPPSKGLQLLQRPLCSTYLLISLCNSFPMVMLVIMTLGQDSGTQPSCVPRRCSHIKVH